MVGMVELLNVCVVCGELGKSAELLLYTVRVVA
jgi:hypothetical protein